MASIGSSEKRAATLALAALLFLLPRNSVAAVASVDLASCDTSSGLTNTQRDDGTDGENDPTECGPASDVRSGRKNKGSSDNDAADAYSYFLVTQADVKA